MGKAEANKLLKEQTLLNTAFELFTDQGAIKTSISDIVNRAGIAKGTFYLYFRDKYDLERKLITSKSHDLLNHAIERSSLTNTENIDEIVIFIINDIIDQLEKNPKLLRFINKNLSWGILKRTIDDEIEDYVSKFCKMAAESTPAYENPKLMLFTITEFVGSTCYSLILDHDPVDMDTYRPYMNKVLKSIIESFRQETVSS